MTYPTIDPEVVAAIQAAPGDTGKLATAIRATLDPPADDETPVSDWYRQAGDILDLLDEAGLWLADVPEVAPDHPATPEQRLEAARLGFREGGLDAADALARWLATGDRLAATMAPATPLAELTVAAEALAEWDAATTTDDAVGAGAGLAHAVRALLNLAT